MNHDQSPDIRQVGGDVVVRDQNGSVLHVLGVNELDLVNHVHFLEQHGTYQAVEIAPGYKAVFALAHDFPLIHPNEIIVYTNSNKNADFA